MIRAAAAAPSVETGLVTDLRQGRVEIQTSRGYLWARCELVVNAGQWVTFTRAADGYQVLALARKPTGTTKTIRV